MADILINILGNASKLRGELDKAGKNVTSFSDKIGKIGKVAAVAGVAITAAFTTVVLKTAAVGDQFDKMALRTGVAVEDLSSLAYATDICGSNIGTMEKGLKALTKVMDDASRGIGEGLDAFRELDIAITDTDGNLRSTVDVLKEAATKISAIEDPTKQAAYAMDLFGSRAGPQLLPLLKMGGAGIEELMKKAEELGITITTEAATAAADFTDRMTELKGSFASVGRMIGDTLIPAITPLIEKATEIVVKIVNWTKENAELTEKIFKWAAGLGVALMFLGPLAMILPSIIVGVGLLSHAFLPFLVGGLIITGLVKLNSLLDDMNEKVYKAQMNFDNISVAEIDAEIESLAQEIKSLKEQIEINKELPLFTSIQHGSLIDMQNSIMNLEMKMGLLIEKRAELKHLEETGVELTYDEIKAREELDKKIKEESERIKALIEEQTEEIKSQFGLLEGSEKLSGKMKILTAEYELSNKTKEDTNKYYQGMLELSEELVKELEAEIKKTKEGTKERDEAILKLRAQEKVTKDLKEAIEELNKVQDLQLTGLELTRAKMELLELRYSEIEKNAGYYKEKLQLLREEHEFLAEKLDKVIKKYGEGTEEYYKALAAIVAIENEMKRWWKEIDKGTETVDEFAQSFADKMLKMKVATEGFKPPDIDPWKEFFDGIKDRYSDTIGTIQTGILNFVSTAENALGDAFYNILSGAESFGDSMRGLFESIVDAVIRELARLAAFYVFKWIFKIPFLKGGGGVGYQFGGEVKKFQIGGGTDSVLAAVTPGEYIIDKPMTDFIKKFRMFPSNLIEAIAGGFPTPAPAAFATGGPVGTPNITASGFGETKIYIDIHDNRIASDIDVKGMAMTIGEEVLRRIEMRRRH